MAITIHQQAASVSPAYNPLWFYAYSNNTAQANFQFLFDLYITGQTFAGASYLRFKVPADPTYGKGIFDVSKVIQRYLSYDITDPVNNDTDNIGFQHSSNSYVEYQVKIGEEYGPSSGVVQYADLAVSAAKKAFNGGFDPIDFPSYNQSYWITQGSGTYSTVNLLTNQPSSGTVRANENQWVEVFQSTSGSCKFAFVNTYDTSNALIASTKIINSTYYTGSYNRLRFPSGFNIDNISSGYIVSGATAGNIINPTNVFKWEIYFADSTGARITESIWFSKDTNCTNRTEYRLHFLNKLGGFDSFTFFRGSQFTTQIERRDYKKVLGRATADNGASSGAYGYTPADVTNQSFYTAQKDNLVLNSDWINDAKSTWLEELVSSPVVFIDDENYGLINVKVVDSSYTRKQNLSDKLFNLQITVQYSFDRYRQTT